MGTDLEDIADDGIPSNDCPICGAPLTPEPLVTDHGIRLVSLCATHGLQHITDPFDDHRA